MPGGRPLGTVRKEMKPPPMAKAAKARKIVRKAKPTRNSFSGDPATAEKTLKVIQDLTGGTEIARLREAIEGIRELTHPI
jgi:hypothetical protein